MFLILCTDLFPPAGGEGAPGGGHAGHLKLRLPQGDGEAIPSSIEPLNRPVSCLFLSRIVHKLFGNVFVLNVIGMPKLLCFRILRIATDSWRSCSAFQR